MRNKIIGIALGIVLGLLVAFIISPRVPSRRVKLLPENGQTISLVEIQYTQKAARQSIVPLCAFLNVLSKDVRVIVVCGTESDKADAIHRLPKRRIEYVVVGKMITGWSKDRFLVTPNVPHTLLLPKNVNIGMPGRKNDDFVGPMLAKAFPKTFRFKQTELSFDTGDILCSGKKVIVSDAMWEKNGRRKTFRRDLEDVFDHEIVWLRDVPDHHIGMFAAPIDDHTAIVGDPDLARPYWSKALDKKYGKADFSPSMTALFHNVADQLQRAGYKVFRVPTVPFDQKTYISYTNGVLERGSVFMPFYGIPKLDDMAVKTYRMLDLKVNPIPVQSVYRLHGTIGCLVNVLERK